ncbi:MAG TPA: glycosyltransferase family 4 protein [Candidatus Sulfotelmatobacter sp.]|nr:glycosyltransferase family 4 protein [Candidatus Sulfotelmatobacter sp.]
MKVLMLGWELPPYNSGGLGIACYEMCKSMSRRGIDIEFILPYRADHNVDFMKVTPASDQSAESFLASGSIYDSSLYENGVLQLNKLSIKDQQEYYSHAVATLVQNQEYDIVHAHDWLTFKAALRVKAMKNWPIILHVHSIESDRAGSKQGNPIVREIESSALHNADRIIAVSDHTRQAIHEDYGVPLDDIEVVHNSIDVSSLELLDDDNAYKYLAKMKEFGYRVVVNIGRLTVQKGLPHLLNSARKVLEKAPKTVFLIVGSGEMHNELVNMAAELGIGQNVMFADFQRGKNWRDAYAVGDLFVLPSVSEPFGLTPLEAIGYGTPALVSKQSGISETLKNALKVDFWDVDEMSNLIAGVVQNDALRDELWKNSFNELGKLSWDESSQKIIDVYSRHLLGAVA